MVTVRHGRLIRRRRKVTAAHCGQPLEPNTRTPAGERPRLRLRDLPGCRGRRLPQALQSWHVDAVALPLNECADSAATPISTAATPEAPTAARSAPTAST